MSAPARRTPLSVLGGYLGAGKTTLVNHLLRNAQGRRLAILVNDFGAIPIDADLIEAQSDDVISIAGGCICCAFGSDLMGALMQLAQRDPAPSHVLIETSGVALPGIVARSAALIPSFAIDGVIVLADAETVRARAADRYMGDTISRQLADADLVILNKVDLVGAVERDALHAWLGGAAPQARVIDAVRAEVPIELISGLASIATQAVPGLLSAGRIRSFEDASTRYSSMHYATDRPLDVTRLAAALAHPVCGLLRAKGVLQDLDGTLKTLHVVGARCEVTPAATDAHVMGLVCIGISAQINHAKIKAALE